MPRHRLRRPWLALLWLWLLLSAPAQAQFETAPTSFLPVEQAYQLVVAEENGALHFDWLIAPGYYLYQHQLRFTLSRDDEQLPLDPPLPSGVVKYDDYFERELAVYYDRLQLSAPLPPDWQRFTLTVRSQGCADAGLCYPPRIQRFAVDLTRTPAQFTELAEGPPAAPAPAQAPTSADLGLWLALGLALLGGLILNLMPCVFPVLAIKVLSFTRAGGEPRRHGAHGWSYSAGVVLSFVLIAALLLALRAGGQAVGWGFQLQSPPVVAALAYLFFSIGLSLSGLIQWGTRLMGVGQQLTQRGGLGGSFATGVLATVVASPCTAPFMGAALGFAVTRPAAEALLVFAALGAGMALPFLLLCYQPRLLAKLPQPGPWMDRFKQLIAFPLYLTAVWLVWVLGRQAGSDAVALLLIGAVALALAAWLWRERSAVGPLWRRLQSWLAALLVAAALALLTLLQSQSPTSAEAEDRYTPERLAALRAAGTPVLVNLTADWCLTCLANEKVALDTEAVRNALAAQGVEYLVGDWTHYDPAISALLSEHGRSGVPLYLLYPAQATAPPRILPQLLTPSIVLRALEDI